LRALPVAALVAVALFAFAFATSIVPWLQLDRQIVSSTPTTLSRIALTDITLRKDARVCVSGFNLDPSAQALQLRIIDVDKARTTPPLRVDVSAPGYRSSARVAGGYEYFTPLVVPFDPPPRDVTGARACVRNEGATVAITATAESVELAKLRVELDGRKIVAQPWLTFVERSPASVLDRGGQILDRVAAFRPFPAVPLLLGVLAVLVLFGVPLAVVAALALAERCDRAKDRA